MFCSDTYQCTLLPAILTIVTITTITIASDASMDMPTSIIAIMDCVVSTSPVSAVPPERGDVLPADVMPSSGISAAA